MSEIVYRGNLSASGLSFISTYQGRTVIIPQIDQNYIRGLQTAQDGLIDDASRGVPQVSYMHNVMPSTEGFQSVTFFQRAASIGAVVVDEIYACKENLNYFVLHKTAPNIYVLAQVAATWNWNLGVIGAPAADISAMISMTAAMVNGITYYIINTNSFYFIANPCRTLDAANNFNVVALTGTGTAFAGRIRGNASCFGYHILFDDTTIAWSATTTPTDFTPSLITGAGFSKVEGARGPIVAVIPHELGLIIYTTANSVAALYTGNARFPFQFKEITGVGGIPDFNLSTNGVADPVISDDSNTNSHYAYTSSGLQLLNANRIITTHPDITDFISGDYFEDFNTTTLLFTRTKLTQQMVRRVQMVADRYLVISYGISTFTHALVYDVINKRIGKLKTPHVLVFTIQDQLGNYPATQYNMGPRGSLAFMTSTGVINTVDFDSVSTAFPTQDSVIMFGKFQEMRNRMIQLEAVELENTQTTTALSAYVYTSLNGKNWTSDDTVSAPTPLTFNLSATNLRTWYAHTTGINHTIAFVGAFYATTLLLKFHRAGRR